MESRSRSVSYGMRVIEPNQLNNSTKAKHRRVKRKKLTLTFLLVLVVVTGYGAYCLKRSLPVLLPVRTAQVSVPAKNVTISWPSHGQAAIGAQGYGLLAKTGNETARPMASIAKVLTALAILKKHPLSLGQKGPTITIKETDVQSYHDYLSNDGSVVAVNLGEELTEYEALQALLIPSGNNIADTLARWAFGSVNDFLIYSNALAKELGLTQTHLDDAGGLSSKTVSTPSDLVKLGLAALNEPVIAEIIKQPKATLPVAGTVLNTNRFAGKNDVIGIKTGHTDESGGCFLLAAKHQFGDNSATVVAVVMGDISITQALTSAVNMLPSVYAGFGVHQVLKVNEEIGYYAVPWADRVNIVTSSELKTFSWTGNTIEPRVELNSLNVDNTVKSVGKITLNAGNDTSQTLLQLASNIPQPSIWWRLSHPF